MKNLIQQLTCREKELFIYYTIAGINTDSRNEFIACTEISKSMLNHLTYRLKSNGMA